MERYNNYHKHDHVSNIFSPDVNVKISDYVGRALELGEQNIWTTNHGCGGDVFEARTVCDKNNLSCKFGMEGYIVPDPLQKDSRNYHIIILPTTNEARKKLNKASTHANRDGYYYKPRFFIDDLIHWFEKSELFITTACIGGLLKDEDGIKQILYPLYEKFGTNLFLEVQNHNNSLQKTVNEKAIHLHRELGLKFIAANDSHYIYPEQAKERLELLRGKGINRTDEDVFILDYPDVDEFYARFLKQGILSKSEIISSIDQTLILDCCENIEINQEIKMPTIYPDKTEDEKIVILKSEVNKRFKKMLDSGEIPKEDSKKYAVECKKEMTVIEETKSVHTADYFLLNLKLFDLAINKYGGILTRTGRGSCGAFLLNKILGLTQIDRLKTTLPLYSERFMSTARILENKALPDFDANVVEQEPFVLASKELLGDVGCFPMVAYGTMKESEAFRNVCRSAGEDFEDFNLIGKSIEKYSSDKKWGTYIEDSNKYVGTIVSVSTHPCAHILSNDDIEREIGLVRCGDFLCALITSTEADDWKYLKNDYLVVSVWDIISKTFALIGEPIMTVQQLLNNLTEKVWKLFDDGLTCTLNQVGEDWATVLIRKYKPRTMEELAMFVSSIRPSFASLRESFIERKPYTTGSVELDKVLESTGHMVLFQENLMQYFEWLGVTPAESIGLIKKISKKKIKQSDFDNLESRIKAEWIRKTGSENYFQETWEEMQSQMAYGFNSPHGEATALDCLYCAYLKAYYPFEYYSVVLNMYKHDSEKTSKLTKELAYFGINLEDIKFRHSESAYSFDKDENTIYKGLSSVKFVSQSAAKELYDLRMINFESFTGLLQYVSENTSVNARQMRVLTTVNFFKEFGNNGKLLEVLSRFSTRFSKTHIEKTKKIRIAEITAFENSLENTSLPVLEQIKYEEDYMGYITLKADVPKRYVYVQSVDSKYTPRGIIYCIKTGKSIEVKFNKKTYAKKNMKFLCGDIIYCGGFVKKANYRKTDSGFEKTGTYSNMLETWEIITPEKFDKIVKERI